MSSFAFTNDGGRVAIQAGQYIVHGDSVVQHAPNHPAKLPCAEDAPFNSFAKQHERTCLRGTRVDLLNEIHGWADGLDKRCIFWLSGLAGTGKSTIARTVARRYCDRGRLAASFFFSRGGGDVSHAGKFVISIAVQLADNVPASRDHMVDRDDIASQSLHDQWQHLVLRPLSKLHEREPYVVVVDALDECDNDDDVQIIVRLLAEAQSLEGIRLRVFLTSRPEVPIRWWMADAEHKDKHKDFVLHSISPSIVDTDISLFLQHYLRIVGQKHSLGVDWPGPEIIEQLVRRACGLFIWAATAWRFISDGKRFAAKRLETILVSNKSTATAPEKHLDEMYVTVLKNSVYPNYTDEEREEHYIALRYILGSIVVSLSSLSVDAWSKLLHVPKQNVDQTLEDLHAILNIPKDPTQLAHIHHPSFRDFLLDKDRCGAAFWVDEEQAHQTLADNCIKLMTASLKQDICAVDNPGALVIIGTERSRILQYLSSGQQYACQYWVEHLRKSGTQLHDDDKVHCFLQKHLLHWFEALSWIGKVSEGIHALIVLESILAKSRCPRLSEYVHDAKRFITSSRPTIELAPLQIYSSALIFAPMRSIIRQQFSRFIPRWIRQIPRVNNDWNAVLQTVETHSNCVNSLSFSADGTVLASAGGDGMVKILDVKSGAVLQTLDEHQRSKAVCSVSFSPNGTLLASSSADGTIIVRDAGSRATTRILKGHLDLVNSIAFSPDGMLLASASSDATVKLWDLQSGKALHTLRDHSQFPQSVAFSPEGTFLASASQDKTVIIWDAGSGATLRILKGHSDRVYSVAFSPDGMLLASASSDTTVKLWDLQSGEALHTLMGHSKWVDCIAFSPDGSLIASSSGDHTVRLWDPQSGIAIQVLEGHSEPVGSVTFSSDGTLLASGSWDGIVKQWDVRLAKVRQMPTDCSSPVESVAFSPNGKLIASASQDTTISLWDVQSGTVLQTFEAHSREVWAVAFSTDGTLLASGSCDNTVKIWDVRLAERPRMLRALNSHSAPVRSVAFSPDGILLVSASYDTTVVVWDFRSGAMLRIFKGHTSSLSSVAVSPSGALVASVGCNSTVKVWDIQSMAVLHTFRQGDTVQWGDVQSEAALTTSLGNIAKIRTLSFSNGGNYLETNIGRLHSTIFPEKAAVLSPTSHTSIFIVGRWVTAESNNVLWFPSEYVPTSTAVHGNKVGLGCSSGQVLVMEFDFPVSFSPASIVRSPLVTR
ncbi:putative WD-repeat protein [Byssothecium circinans]|uniref:Putative WD-repeat protein n=1 Tax=Byssothecium circinans TaxID=147558 RepID=A0A6A5UBD2_9PLEO|nr:putative WD-repeat protein [Byssothecium circinans]